MSYFSMIGDMFDDVMSRHVAWSTKLLTIGTLFLQLAAVYIAASVIYKVVNEAGIESVKTAYATIDTKGSSKNPSSVAASNGRSTFFMSFPAKPKSVTLTIDGQSIHEFVNKDVYRTLNAGSNVLVTYGYGRVDGSIVVLTLKVL